MPSPSHAFRLRAQEELATNLAAAYSGRQKVGLDVLCAAIALRDGRCDQIGHGQQARAGEGFGVQDHGAITRCLVSATGWRATRAGATRAGEQRGVESDAG